jgi:putative flippase GtrA
MGTQVISPVAMLERLPSLKYLMVGAFCALLNLLIQYAAVALFGAHYAVGILLSFLILVPLSFCIHKNVTFRTEGKLSWRRFCLYTTQWIVLLVLNIFMLGVFVELLHLPYPLAMVLAALIGTLLSYRYSRSYVFQQVSAPK